MAAPPCNRTKHELWQQDRGYSSSLQYCAQQRGLHGQSSCCTGSKSSRLPCVSGTHPCKVYVDHDQPPYWVRRSDRDWTRLLEIQPAGVAGRRPRMHQQLQLLPTTPQHDGSTARFWQRYLQSSSRDDDTVFIQRRGRWDLAVGSSMANSRGFLTALLLLASAYRLDPS